jgi:hypothetical protein
MLRVVTRIFVRPTNGTATEPEPRSTSMFQRIHLITVRTGERLASGCRKRMRILFAKRRTPPDKLAIPGESMPLPHASI